MEIRKVWDKLFKMLWYLAAALAVTLVAVGFFWSKFNEYYKQIWPSFIGTCFGVVFSAGFAGAFLAWQMTTEQKTNFDNQKKEALLNLEKWEITLSALLSEYRLEPPNFDMGIIGPNINAIKEDLIEIRVQAAGVKARIKDIADASLTSTFNDLTTNIEELSRFINEGRWGGFIELNKLVDKVRLAFKNVQSITSNLHSK